MIFIKVTLLKTSSLCPGIITAIKIVNNAPRHNCFLFAPLAHNATIQQAVAEAGIIDVAKNFSLVPDNSTIIFGAHGIKLDDLDIARKKNLTVIDTTCSIVKQIAELIKQYLSEDYHIFIIGKKDHQEANALASLDYQKIKIIENAEDIPKINHDINVLITTQTTISQEEIDSILPLILKHYPKATFIDKRCKITKNNQELLSNIDSSVEALIIVSDTRSNNGIKLKQIASLSFPEDKIFFITNLSELNIEKIVNLKHVAIAASSSTPDALVASLKMKLEQEDWNLADIKMTLQDIVDYHK